MPIDASIYQQGIKPGPTVVQGLDSLDQQGINQLQLASGQQKFAEDTAVINEKNQLRQLLGSGQVDLTTPQGRNALYAAAPTLAPGVLKTMQDQMTAQAAANKDNAQASNFTADAAGTNVKTKIDKANQAISDITSLASPQDALTSIQQHMANGDIDMQKASDLVNTLQPALQDPTQFGKWQRGMVIGIMDAKDRIAATAPKITMTNAGGQIVPTNENADASTPVGPVAGAAPIQVTQSPDNAATNATSRANVATTQAHEDSRQANSLAIEKVKADPYGTLGLNTNVPATTAAAAGTTGDAYLATLAPGVAAQVKAMSDGKLQITPQSLRTPQGQELLRMAMQYEPGTDQTTYASRAATAKDAASGKLATSNNALNTVAGHLAALSESAAALNNTSFPWVNTVKNFASDAVGNPQVRTFNLNLQGVSDELERAYRGAGGSESSIKQWQKNLGDASSPEQFQSAMAMGAEMIQSKLEANQAQYAQGMSGKTGSYSSMTPKAAAALAKLRGATAPTASPATPGSVVPGWTILGVH